MASFYTPAGPTLPRLVPPREPITPLARVSCAYMANLLLLQKPLCDLVKKCYSTVITTSPLWMLQGALMALLGTPQEPLKELSL